MTAILVTEDLKIYTDSMVTEGDRCFVGNYQKIHEHKDGTLMAFTGERKYKFEFMENLPYHLDIDDYSDVIFPEKLTGVIVNCFGVFKIEDHLIIPVEPPFSLGSGSREVLAAYLACGDPVKSIEVTSQLVTTVGGKVQCSDDINS